MYIVESKYLKKNLLFTTVAHPKLVFLYECFPLDRPKHHLKIQLKKPVKNVFKIYIYIYIQYIYILYIYLLYGDLM